MKYNININQEKLSGYDITLQDACVIDWLQSMFGSDHERITEKRLGGYTWISLSYMIEDMPLLRIKTNSGASKLIKRLEKIGLIETKTDKKDRKLYAKPTSKFKELYFGVVSHRTQPRVPEETSQVPQDTNQYTSINTLLDTSETEVSATTEQKITLPLHRGTSPNARLISIYGTLYEATYKVKPKISFPLFGKIIKGLLADYTEVQLGMLMLVFFDWRGLQDDKPQEYKYLYDNCFPITMFSKDINKYEVYVRQKSKVDFDKDQDIIKNLAVFIPQFVEAKK